MNAFLCQMVDDYCTTISESFTPAIFHMLLTAIIINSLLLHTFALRFDHGLTSGYFLLFKMHSTFIITLSLPVSTYCFYLGILLKRSSSWLLTHRYHWPIRGVTTSIFMAFSDNIHVTSAVNGIHHFIAIPLHGSLYLQSWLDITALLALSHSSSMIFTTPTLNPWFFIISFFYHLLFTGRLIGSKFIPPVPKFRIFCWWWTPL